MADLQYCFYRERYVGVAAPHTERLPVDLRIAACHGVAVSDVVQVDEGSPARSDSRLNRRVIVSRCVGRPSSQQNSCP